MRRVLQFDGRRGTDTIYNRYMIVYVCTHYKHLHNILHIYLINVFTMQVIISYVTQNKLSFGEILFRNCVIPTLFLYDMHMYKYNILCQVRSFRIRRFPRVCVINYNIIILHPDCMVFRIEWFMFQKAYVYNILYYITPSDEWWTIILSTETLFYIFLQHLFLYSTFKPGYKN